MTAAGFPHSGTPGSQPTCGSPRLFAACRALLRLSVPRHPPCALVSLDRYPRTPSLTWIHRSTDSQNTHMLSVLSRLISTLHFTQSHDPCFQSTKVRGVLAQCVDL